MARHHRKRHHRRTKVKGFKRKLRGTYIIRCPGKSGKGRKPKIHKVRR